MAEQVVKMVIKVDLQCDCCYQKIKKILCEIPQVKDQSFDKKQNTVTITVEGCSPENVLQKILCTGICFVQRIEIIRPKPADPTPVDTKKPCPPPPVLGCPPVYAMGWVSDCPSCHNQGCGWFCPCNCHYGGPPMCDDGCGRPAHKCRCGRPPICPDGCGRPVHDCRCGRPPICPDGCGRPVHDCRCGRPPMCPDGCGKPAHDCRCGTPPMCPDGCGKPVHECRCGTPPMCRDGCRRPAHECRCQRPRCCDRCNDENASSSCTMHSCDCGRPPVCTNAGYEYKSSCSLM